MLVFFLCYFSKLTDLIPCINIKKSLLNKIDNETLELKETSSYMYYVNT